MSYLKSLADFCYQYYVKDFPASIMTQAKISLVDYFSAILWGTRHDQFELARNYVQKAQLGNCTVIGLPTFKTSSSEAAFINAFTAHLMEIDDIHLGTAGLHPGVTVIPSVLALAEEMGSTGTDILKSIIIGYEVAGRIGKSISPSHRYQGFHATGTIGGFGATAASAFLKKLSADKFANSLALASAQAGGTFAVLSGGVSVKYLHAGFSARNGILNTLYTESGFEGPLLALEYKEGFANAYAREHRLEEISAGLGETFEISHVFRKRSFICGHVFPAIDAAMASGSLAVNPESITKIDVTTYKAAAELNDRRPENYNMAKFSIPYCLASVIYFGTVQDYFTSSSELSRINQLADKIFIHMSDQFTMAFPAKRTTEVVITMENGDKMTGRVHFPKGMPENPLGEKEIFGKFQECLLEIYSQSQGKKLISILKNIEELSNISYLIEEIQQAFT